MAVGSRPFNFHVVLQKRLPQNRPPSGSAHAKSGSYFGPAKTDLIFSATSDGIEYGLYLPNIVMKTLMNDSQEQPLPPGRRTIREKLVGEAESIYTRLNIAEARCIKAQKKLCEADSNDRPRPSNAQWKAAIALHQVLLREHYNYLLVSSHPSAIPPLRRLPSTFSTPSRAWKHGIYGLVEHMIYHLPRSRDYVVNFLGFSYSTIALFYETAPLFEEVWVGCLGDIARYRAGIEKTIKDKQIWTAVAVHWCLRSCQINPGLGRPFFYLLILSKPRGLQRLYYLAKSLCAEVPFQPARELASTIVKPTPESPLLEDFESVFSRLHGFLFTNRLLEFHSEVATYFSLIKSYIMAVRTQFKKKGCQIAIVNSCAILGNFLEGETIKAPQPKREISFEAARQFSNNSLHLVLQRVHDPNILSYIHVTLVFMYFVTQSSVLQFLATGFPWQSMVIMLNTVLQETTSNLFEKARFPVSVGGVPEDFSLRGLVWARDYFKEMRFEQQVSNEQHTDLPSTDDCRKCRILWLACRIAASYPLLQYDNCKRLFFTGNGKGRQLRRRTLLKQQVAFVKCRWFR